MKSKKGVIETLGLLDSNLDCFEALLDILKPIEKNIKSEHFFITHEETLHHFSYISNVSEIQNKLTYLIVLNRKGELNFYQFNNGRKKLLSTTKYDLEELLKGKKIKYKKKKKRYGEELMDLPAYFYEKQAPLYFPTVGMKFRDNDIYKNYQEIHYENEFALVGITEEERLLSAILKVECFWKRPQ